MSTRTALELTIGGWLLLLVAWSWWRSRVRLLRLESATRSSLTHCSHGIYKLRFCKACAEKEFAEPARPVNPIAPGPIVFRPTLDPTRYPTFAADCKVCGMYRTIRPVQVGQIGAGVCNDCRSLRIKFKPGQWVRYMPCDLLVQTKEFNDDPSLGKRYLVIASGGDSWVDESSLELALPREDEYWEKRRCAKDHGRAFLQQSIRWAYTSGDYCDGRFGLSKGAWQNLFAAERAACECGCLVPVNFAKGYE